MPNVCVRGPATLLFDGKESTGKDYFKEFTGIPNVEDFELYIAQLHSFKSSCKKSSEFPFFEETRF